MNAGAAFLRRLRNICAQEEVWGCTWDKHHEKSTRGKYSHHPGAPPLSPAPGSALQHTDLSKIQLLHLSLFLKPPDHPHQVLSSIWLLDQTALIWNVGLS